MAGTVIVWSILVVAGVYRVTQGPVATSAAVENWATVFVALILQVIPFLVLGVTLSAAISALVPKSWLARVVPKRTAVAVPAAGLAGAVLPGCECSAVPVAGRLVGKGVAPAAALTFLLAAPAINPVVMISTAAAFPGEPKMVLARFIASLSTAVVVGYLWSRFAPDDVLEQRLRSFTSHEHSHSRAFAETAGSDFLQAGGFLVLGAALVATLQTLVPINVIRAVGGDGVVAILVLAALAVVLSICSEADAFVAAGLTQFSLTSRLVFLVVGPMVDIKLVAMQAGTFGRRFASRFAPLTLAVAIVTAVVVGSVVW